MYSQNRKYIRVLKSIRARCRERNDALWDAGHFLFRQGGCRDRACLAFTLLPASLLRDRGRGRRKSRGREEGSERGREKERKRKREIPFLLRY